jgi:hypothetical protein
LFRPHPEFAWVFSSTVFIGVAGKSTKVPEEFVKQIAILRITRVERLPAANAGSAPLTSPAWSSSLS